MGSVSPFQCKKKGIATLLFCRFVRRCARTWVSLSPKHKIGQHLPLFNAKHKASLPFLSVLSIFCTRAWVGLNPKPKLEQHFALSKAKKTKHRYCFFCQFCQFLHEGLGQPFMSSFPRRFSREGAQPCKRSTLHALSPAGTHRCKRSALRASSPARSTYIHI